MDYFRRKLEIAEGNPARDFLDEEEFTIAEVEEDNLRLNCEENEMLDDNGLIDYLTVPSGNKEAQLPQSLLYFDPYNPCTCGFDDPQKWKKQCKLDHCLSIL